MRRFRRIAERYVGLSSRHPFLLLLVYAGLTVLSTRALLSLTVNTDFRSLLPKDTPSVQALEESEDRRGSSDLYTIAVESPDPYANVAFIEALAERIEADWSEAQWVQVDEDPTFFRDHILLYVPLERLETFLDDLDSALDCELADVNPLFINVSDDCENLNVEWTFDYWLGNNLASDLGVPEDFFGNIEAELGDGSGDDEEPAEEPESGEPEAGSTQAADAASDEDDGELPDDLRHYIISSNGRVAVLYVQLDQPSTDVEFANRMQERGTALIAELDPSSFHPEMKAEVVGAYQSLNEAREAVGDSTRALWVSTAFVLGFMLIFFRNLRGLLVVFVPLVMGVSWTMGLTRLTYDELNLYTLFVGSVLVGMGIDFGIHLYGRAMEGFRRGEAWNEALVEALDHTGRAIAASAVTTVGALLTLLFSHFQGFIEFGVIASYGIVLCLLSAYLVVPAMVYALDKIWPLKRRGPLTATEAAPSRGRSRRIWLVPTLVTLLLVIGGAILSPRAAFEYDFRNYRSKSTQSTTTIHYGQAVGRGRTSSPAIILGHSEEQMREVHQLLRDRLKEGDPMLAGFITIQTYVPPDQEDRLAVIERIARKVNRRALNRLGGDTKEFVDLIRDLVDVAPFSVDDIPDWALRTIQEQDGSVGELGLLFRRIEEWDVLEVREYKRRYALLQVEAGDVPVADGTFITSDIISTVQADGARMGVLVSIMLTVVLLIALRSVRGTVICMLTMGAAFAMTLGAMVLTNTKVGMFNMIVVPAVLGVSIDGAIHIFHRYREEGRRHMGRVLRTTGLAVAAASLTTAGGFGGLLFQNHRGIASIGQLAVIGILSALIAVYAFMPGILVLLERPKDKAKTAPRT